jgi:Phasin protein
MATKAGTQDATRETIDRIRELNEQIIDVAREAGESYLEMYERALGSIAGYQKQLAGVTGVDWLQRVIDAQAAFMQDMGRLYASSAREAMNQ